MKSKKEFDFSESGYRKFASIQREITNNYVEDYFSLSDMADGLLDELGLWKKNPPEFFEWLEKYRCKNDGSKRVHKVLLLFDYTGKTLGDVKKALNAKRPENVSLVTTSEVLEFALEKYGEKVLSVFRGKS